MNKKVGSLFLVVIFLFVFVSCGNKPAPDKSSIGGAQKKEGYHELTENVYYNKNLDKVILPENLGIYPSEEIDFPSVLNEIRQKFSVTEETEIKEGIRLKTDDSLIVTGNPYKLFLFSLSTEKGKQGRIIFNDILQRKLTGQNKEIDLRAANFSTEEEIGKKCHEVIQDFSLFFGGNYDIYSVTEDEYKNAVSPENLKMMQDNSIRELDINDEFIEPFYFVKFIPSIDNIDVVDETTVFGSPEERNVSSGPKVCFIIDKEGFIDIDIASYVKAGNDPIKEIPAGNVNSILEVLREKYSDIIMSGDLFIEDMRAVYAPLSIGDYEYNYYPLIEITVADNDGKREKLFYNPEKKEVMN